MTFVSTGKYLTNGIDHFLVLNFLSSGLIDFPRALFKFPRAPSVWFALPKYLITKLSADHYLGRTHVYKKAPDSLQI
jgi:hypothetical protein